ncbi:MAG TPA: retropepsin-like aspartic protease [Tepidisphaeraceae bacterium]|nr:retropepsin-like aspartic protease [Tepidisphaeraceae bacterium]
MNVVRADKAADVLTANHLQAGTDAYVLSDEAAVLDGMKSLRTDKKKVDENKRLRKAYDAKISSSKALIEQNYKDYTALKDRLTVVTDASVHNRMVLRMNMLVLKSKQAAEAQKDAEDKENAMSIDPETKYVDGLLALGTKADAAGEAYTSLASNAAVKSALQTATPRLPLGPSKTFADAISELKKWRDEVESEAIPLSEDGGVQKVVALINGAQHKFILDPGSSLVSIPGEMADELKLTITDQDPVVQLKLADGNIIQGKRISLKNIRVGRFSVDNVACVVLAKGLPDAPALLGNSFLSHFIVKLDQKAGQLQLVEVGNGTAASSAKPSVKSPGASTGKIEEK